MRLTEKEIEAIRKIILGKDPNAEIHLFGSRARNDLAGGDIDLLVLSEALGFKDKISLLIALKEELGDQKIDLILQTRSDASKDAFSRSVLGDSKRIS